MPDQFHFLQPLWLLALIPLGLLLRRLRHAGQSDNPWLRLIDARLQPLLLSGQGRTGNRAWLWLLASGWLIATVALANPVWEKQPRPLFQTPTARVLVLDLSTSMLDRDLKPTRLARARFKIEDILARNEEGQTGLVVFAGDAFTVTPLTRDVDTIRALLRSLEPGLMPVQGSRVDLGLARAGQLLRQAGLARGQILLLADGVADDRAIDVARKLHRQGYRISVLGVGTAQAEPLTDTRGVLLRDSKGRLVVPGLQEDALRAVAEAGGGRYRRLGNGDADLTALLDSSASDSASPVSADLHGQDWQSRGPWLVLLLLPLAALAFRRGWLLGLVLVAGLGVPPEPVIAADWSDLWQRPEQQAHQALQQKDYARASALAEDPLLKGSAEYKQGNYEQALEAFSRSCGPVADYNRGNALARLGRYKEAIAAYEAALKAAPHMQDAMANKQAVEALLKKRDAEKKDRQQASNGQPQSDGKQQGQQNSSGKEQQKQGNQGQPGKDQQQAANGGTQGQQAGNEQQDRNTGQGTRTEKQGQQAGKEPQNPQTGSGQQAGKDQQGHNAPRQARTGQAGDTPKDAQKDQKHATNQFAEAARKLQAQSGQPQPSAEQDLDEATGNTSRTEQAQQQQARNARGQEAQPGEGAPRKSTAAMHRAEALSSEEQMAAEQWLRRVPDDPGGLLRRKFLYQYQQRAQRDGTGSRQPW